MAELKPNDWVEVVKGPRKGEVGSVTYIRDGIVGVYIHGSAYWMDPTTFTVGHQDVERYLGSGKGYIFALLDKDSKRIGRFRGFPGSPDKFVRYKGVIYSLWHDGDYRDAGCYEVTNVVLDAEKPEEILKPAEEAGFQTGR